MAGACRARLLTTKLDREIQTFRFFSKVNGGFLAGKRDLIAMKISDVGSSKKTTRTKKKQAVPGHPGDFAQQLKGTADPAETAPSVEVGTLSGVDSVLSIQESTSATGEKSRSLAGRYGDDLLGRLDELRLGLLAGSFPKEKLADLAKTMRARRQESDDAKLNEIINEIELRAEVEIAKLTRGT